MQNIKKIITSRLYGITLGMVAALLIFSTVIQISNARHYAVESSEISFYHIEQLLSENKQELADVKEQYRNTCLLDAEGIAYILQRYPDAIYSIDDLKKIAEFMEVDEIHIFDKTGRIISGTHPEYYGLTFDSGEQLSFFKPMLTDKTLRLCQDVTPNTAESKLMQYSALWSENGEFIVQIGMQPVNVMKVTEKNELSYIFSMLRSDPEIDLYAAELESGVIIGSTDTEDVGKDLEDIGISLSKAKDAESGFDVSVNGVKCYCIFRETDGILIGRIITNKELYRNIPYSICVLAAGLLLISAILVQAFLRCINKFVIDGIYDVNSKLRMITEGDLDEKISVDTSLEFSELSSHINEMIESLLSSTDKISYVLNSTDVHIGVYEYSEKMKRVRFTEQVPEILALDREKSEMLFADQALFRQYIADILDDPVDGENSVYRLGGETEHFIKLKEISNGRENLGIVIDVTEETLKRRKIEAERDIDLLTGLYNRRGLQNRLSELFSESEKTGYGAIAMIDADGLKEINDRYGHDKGDMYLRSIADAISSVGSNGTVCARQGGDEFVLFLYNYPDEKELREDIDKLAFIQQNGSADLGDGLTVSLRFSFGYCMTKGETDTDALLKLADEKMYRNKSERKKAMLAQM